MRCEVAGPASIAVALAGFVALGCDGTVDSETIESALYVINITHADVELEVYRPLALLDCEAVSEDPENTLDTSSFAFDRCRASRPFLSEPLDTDWVVLFDRDGYPIEQKSPSPEPRACDAVVMFNPRLGARAVFWNDVRKVQVARIDQEHAPRDPHALYLEGFGERLVMSPSSLASVWEPTLPADRGSCP